MPQIRAASIGEVSQTAGEWAFVDLGFARDKKSCCLLVSDGEPREMTFAHLTRELTSLLSSGQQPLNLLIEAPLSVSFGQNGNPSGRSIEKREQQTRYWYVGLGCSVLVAATYLLRSLHTSNSPREVRLVEGLVSFKDRGVRSSHSQDVLDLRALAWSQPGAKGKIVPPEKLGSEPGDIVSSAFLVAGMDFGVPPVVAAGA